MPFDLKRNRNSMNFVGILLILPLPPLTRLLQWLELMRIIPQWLNIKSFNDDYQRFNFNYICYGRMCALESLLLLSQFAWIRLFVHTIWWICVQSMHAFECVTLMFSKLFRVIGTLGSDNRWQADMPRITFALNHTFKIPVRHTTWLPIDMKTYSISITTWKHQRNCTRHQMKIQRNTKWCIAATATTV